MFATNWTSRRPGAVLGALLALTVLAGCSGGPPPPPANSVPVIVPGGPGEEASTIPPGEASSIEQPGPNDADKRFVQNMIVHHQQALTMAALAPERASSRDVKEMAGRITDVQGPEIDMMNRWLSRNNVPTVDPTAPGHGHAPGTMPGMATDEQLDELRAARGEAFDRLFLQLMVTHHEGALAMAEEVRPKGADVRVQQMADDIVAEQADEIRRMRQWLDG